MTVRVLNGSMLGGWEWTRAYRLFQGRSLYPLRWTGGLKKIVGSWRAYLVANTLVFVIYIVFFKFELICPNTIWRDLLFSLCNSFHFNVTKTIPSLQQQLGTPFVLNCILIFLHCLLLFIFHPSWSWPLGILNNQSKFWELVNCFFTRHLRSSIAWRNTLF